VEPLQSTSRCFGTVNDGQEELIIMRTYIPAFVASILSIGAVVAAADDKPTASDDATFKSLDRDTDQRLSKEEAAGDQMLSEHFAMIDADRDGYLTKREYTTHMKEMKSQKKEY
jgi:hypothetical protein